MFSRSKIKADQLGLVFKDGQFQKIVREGAHWFFNPLGKIAVERISLRTPVFTHRNLRDIVKSEALKGIADVLDMRDWQRALIWIDGRFFKILPAGLFAVWTEMADVRIEVIDARKVRFDHEELAVISRSADADQLNVVTVDRDHEGVLFVDG